MTVREIVPIVEGQGEVESVGILLRRIGEWIAPGVHFGIARPIRVQRAKVVRPGEIERAIELAARSPSQPAGILVLLDADDDCPRDLAPSLLTRARHQRGDRSIRVVLANREFEAWFLAAAESIAGVRGLQPDLSSPPDPESIRDAKHWLSDHMPAGRSYRPVLDQPPLTARFDLAMARRAPSFDKLCRDIASMLRGEV